MNAFRVPLPRHPTAPTASTASTAPTTDVSIAAAAARTATGGVVAFQRQGRDVLPVVVTECGGVGVTWTFEGSSGQGIDVVKQAFFRVAVHGGVCQNSVHQPKRGCTEQPTCGWLVGWLVVVVVVMVVVVGGCERRWWW